MIAGRVPREGKATLAPISPAWFALIGTLDFLGQSSILIFFLLFPSGRFVPRWSRWVAFGFSTGIPGFVLTVLLLYVFLPSVLHQSTVITSLVGGTLIYGFLLLIPISIAIAILRSQLYDIDIVINRALAYGSLTGILGALYAGFIIGLESLAGAITGQASGQPVALVISTVAIFALFQPVRKNIQALIDRRFYRKKYDAEKTLAAFSTVLRSEVDLNQLRGQLIAVVQETMQPAHVSLWLRQPEQRTEEQLHRLTLQGQVSSKSDTD